MVELVPDPVHPAVVHFPIAAVVTAWMLDLLALGSRLKVLRPGATAVWILAAVTAALAYLTGNAAHAAAVLPPEAVALAERHAFLAWWSLTATAALAVTRVVVLWQGRFRGGVRVIWLLMAGGVVLLVVLAARAGGQLVFDHGVGTAPVQQRRMAPVDTSFGEHPGSL